MTNYNGNQQQDKKSVYTNGVQFYNSKTDIYPSTLQLSHWDNFARITISPAKAVEQRTENSIFDYDTKIATALSVRDCAALLESIDTLIMPALKINETKGVGVITGGVNQVGVYTNNGSCMLMIFKDINSQTKIPAKKYGYIFNKTLVIEDYDPDSGNHTLKEFESEFEVFKAFLKAVVDAGSGAYAHQDDLKNRFKKKEVEGTITWGKRQESPFSMGHVSSNNSSQQEAKSETLEYSSNLSALLSQ